MPRTDSIELDDGRAIVKIPILFEDRSVLAVDKPPGWMLVPYTWQRTSWNLLAAIQSSIAARDFWARSRNLKFLRNIHRLDAETSGVLLFARSLGALDSIGRLFETRRMFKRYFAVVEGRPRETAWKCELKLARDEKRIGRVRVDERHGKEAETEFRVVATDASSGRTLVEARPRTGRTHQIRVHLAAAGLGIVGDALYGSRGGKDVPMALRSAELSYTDPFTRRRVRIEAPMAAWLKRAGFDALPAGLGPEVPAVPGTDPAE